MRRVLVWVVVLGTAFAIGFVIGPIWLGWLA